jgi:hypothetical protein
MAGRERPWSVAAAAVLGLAGLLAVSGFGAQRSAGPGGWSKAIILAAQGNAPSAISCLSPGNCTAVIPGTAAYVLSEVKGKWGSPKKIPGLARTPKPFASPNGVVCRGAGCVVVGSYTDAAGHGQAFILSETRGTWDKPLWVPGLAKFDRGHSAGLGQLWCPSAGNCVAVGSYTDAARNGQPFVVSQTRGTWGSATPVPSPTGLPGELSNPVISFGAVTCSAPGNCVASGGYPVSNGNQLFVISQVNGVWGSAIQIPGTVALNTGVEAGVNTMACASSGNCSVGGFYWTSTQFQDAFVANQVNGTWHNAIEVPGIAKHGGAQSWISSISCPSTGNCTAGGTYQAEDSERPFGTVFVVNEVNGTWRGLRPIAGIAKLNNGDDASVTSVSCSTAGNCGVGGYYTPSSAEAYPFWDAFVISETKDTWSKAVEVPGTGRLNTGVNASTSVVSCAGTGPSCAAGGNLFNNMTGFHAFIVNKP